MLDTTISFELSQYTLFAYLLVHKQQSFSVMLVRLRYVLGRPTKWLRRSWEDGGGLR
jgi:hypothetical protein